jgi:glucose/arabinose dehydrogenase
MKTFFIAISLSLLASISFAKDQYDIDGMKVRLEKVFQGEDVIWGMDFVSDHEMIFSERKGKLKLLDLKTNKVQELGGVPKVFAEDQGGLLDVFFDRKDQTLYLTYSDPSAPKPATSLFKAKLSADKKSIKGSRIFQAKVIEVDDGMHFGSRVLVDSKGFIFMSLGERNKRDFAQRLDNDQGKIIRLTNEGKAPADNPFIGKKDALPEIWSYGHRNPQGLALNSKGELYNAEFGPRGGDEVNLIKKGANYGWPVITFGREYYGPKIGSTSKEGMEQPVFYWVPSINPSGMTFYNEKALPAFKDHLILALLSGHILRINLDTKKETKILEDLDERVRQVKVGPDEFLYLSTDSGKLLRIRPN